VTNMILIQEDGIHTPNVALHKKIHSRRNAI